MSVDRGHGFTTFAHVVQDGDAFIEIGIWPEADLVQRAKTTDTDVIVIESADTNAGGGNVRCFTHGTTTVCQYRPTLNCSIPWGYINSSAEFLCYG